MLNLPDTLHDIEKYRRSSEAVIPASFLPPSFWTTLAAFASANGLSPDHFVYADEQRRRYASAIALGRALTGVDDYQYVRQNEGSTYSTLEHLANSEATNRATSRINSCIRAFVGDDLPADFIAALCEVIGDLHDNVWAHGLASGFSMAQRWKTAGSDNDHSLEFALTDRGMGFLREMHRVGISATDDREAIEWCIQEGHSTKKRGPTEWSQRMPEDITNNPLRGIEGARFSDNHHMGLGLFKLTQLVRGFRGTLWLATGSAVLTLAPSGQKIYS